MGTYNFREALKNKKGAGVKGVATTVSTVATKAYDFRSKLKKGGVAESIGLDTLGADLAGVGSTLETIYGGWQSPEDLKKARESVDSVYSRLASAKSNGVDVGFDVDSVLGAYDSVYADWDNITSTYGRYKDADSYKKESAKLSELSSMTLEELESRLEDENGIAYTTYGGEDITWKSLYDSKRHATMASSKEGAEGWEKYLADEAKRREEAEAESSGKLQWLVDAIGGISDTTLPTDSTSRVINEKRKDDSYMHPTDDWSDEERRIFGAYYYEDAEKAYEYATNLNNEKNRKKKNEQKQSVAESATSGFWAGAGHSMGAILATPSGLADYLGAVTDSIAGRPIIESSDMSLFDYSQTVQGSITGALNEYGTVPEQIPVIGGKGLGEVYSIGTSTLQSMVSALALGTVGTFVNYFGQSSASGVKDALERGATDEQALKYGLALGIAEGAPEAISAKFLNGLGAANKNALMNLILSQGGEEFVEEGLTSILGQMADEAIMQDKSGFNNLVRKYMTEGMSEADAKKKAWADTFEGIAFDALSGFISGTAHAGVKVPINTYVENNKLGQAIREYQNVGDLKGIASEVNGDAYRKYIELIESDKISDAKLGRMFTEVSSEVNEGFDKEVSKSVMQAVANRANELGDSANSGMIASAIQKHLSGERLSAEEKTALKSETAQVVLEDIKRRELGLRPTEALESRRDLVKRTNALISPTTRIKATGEAVKIEGIKSEEGETVLVTSAGEFKESDVTLSQNYAEIKEYAEGMEDSEKANLFVSQYDGQSKVSDYITSFEMAYTYGETGIGADNALKHKGILTEAQVADIYKGAMHNKARVFQMKVDAINTKHGSATSFIEGTFNDDIINYGEEDVEGKIKWSSLKSQQGAIRFMQAFAKKAGVNITLVASKVVDGKHVGKNGSYNPETNTIEIDVYAGRMDASIATDAIINTLSHELTHWMKAKSPSMYRAMQEIAMNNISRYDVDGLVEGEKKRLDDEHKKRKHTDEDAIDEIVARTCEDMLSNSKTARQLLSKLSVEEQKTLVDKAKAYINNVIGWIDELMGVYSSNSAEAKLLREHKEAFKEMSKLWDKALAEAIQTNQSLQKEGVTGEKLSRKGEFQWSDRVSDEFALDATIEQTDGMIAVHNLSEEKLLKTIKLGAFPMPSIAITRASIGHKGFGSISLMFRKDTIDPRVFSSNKVYSGDAWTPTYPRIDYKVNEAVEDRARDKYYELSKRFGDGEVRPLYRYAENLEDTLNRDGGEKAMLERMYEDTGIMQIYLQDVGKGKIAPIEVETRTEMSKEEIEANRSFAEAIGSDILAEFETPSGENPKSHRKEYFEKYKVEIENAYRKVLIEHYGLTEEEAQSELNAIKPMKMATILRNALQYIKTNGVTVRVEVDREATNRAIREASGDGYKAWIDSLFKGVEEKTGIRNDKDTFTASGNRRSWDVLHYEETLENVIKAMRAQGEKGIGVFGGNTNIFGASAKDLTSMAEIREEGKRLRNVSQEEFGEMKDSFLGRFRSMADSLRKQDGWQALDSASELLVEAVSKHKTREGIAGYIKREGKGWTNYSDSIVDELIALVNDIRNMPVNYFEAKPMRAVGFDEVACAIIPNNTSENARAELSRLSIPMREYEAGDEDARVEALASVEGVQFSDRGTWSSKDIENYHAFGEQINSLLSHEFDESNNLLVLNKTPDLLQKIGLDDKKILMTVKHFRNIVHPKGKNPHWHGLSYAQVKEAPIILEHPAIVVDSMTQSNAVIVISDLLDNDGNPIIISIATDGKGTHEYQMIPSNFLTSMYGREKFNNFITNLLKQNKMLYIDNKKSHDLYKNLGLQLPSAFTQIGFDKIIQQSKNIVKAQNSDRDSQGSILTEEQQKYFANSQVRDANGSLKVMYHGTGETFTVFDKKKAKSSGYYGSGFYFTESESHASQYGSSHKVYLNITNPLHDGTNDITKAQLKKFVQAIADNEDYGIENYGYGATVDSVVDSVWGSDDFGMIMDLNATCIGDMVEATLLFNEVNGSTYDGIFVPTETVAFYPNQIKNTDNENPTSDADIRYSDRETTSVFDTMGESERLKRENARLRDDIARLRERLALEKKITNGNAFNENQLRAVAKHLIKTANTEYDEKALIDDLREVYTYIATTPNLEWEDLMVRAYDVANGMMRKQRPTKITNDYFKQVLKDIRQTRISLSADQIAEAKSAFGEKYRNAFLGRVVLVNDGTSLDRQWQEWASQYPEIFDAEVSVPDQIVELASILDSLKDGAEVFHTYNDIEATRELAVEIYNQYWNVSTIRTTADKYDKQIKRLNFEHRKAMDEMRSDFKQRLAGSTAGKQRLADSMHYGKIIKNIRDQRDAKVKEARELGKKRMTDYKDRVARNAEIQKITKKALTLNQWLKKNSKDEHIPEIMKAPVAYLLDAIDFSSKQLLGMTGGARANTPTRKDLSLSKAFEKVHDMVQGITSVQIGEDNITEIYGTFADFPVGFADDVKKLSSVTNDIMREVGDNAYVLNDMTLEQLEKLNEIITVLKATVGKMNRFLAIRHAEGVASMAQQDIAYLDSLGKRKTYDGVVGGADKMIQWGNATPHYAFKRFGEGGKKVMDAIKDGWDSYSFHIKEIIDYTEKAYTSEEAKAWAEDVKEFDVLIPPTEADLASDDYKPQYQKVQMTVPQIMALYCTVKREQAKTHLFGGGMRVTDFKTKKGTVSQPEGAILTESEIAKITGSLTDRQREVADALQRFMNTTCSDWGNEVSMLRFGIKQFGEENYFPIQSDRNNLAVDDETERNNSLFRLLNMSFTKSLTEGANNRIVIGDIFDIFAQHTSDMAKYNSMALPILDAFKWYNYKEKVERGNDTQFTTMSLKQSLETAFGKDAQNYITTLLKDINGAESGGRDSVGKGFFTNAKIASVGLNARVVALQPTSYVRASAVIDSKYLAKAFTRKPNIKMAEQYCGIALWKSLGFFDINIQKSVTTLIKHDQTAKDKIVEASMKGAEMADKLTWGYLWNACEIEIREQNPNLVGEELYKKVGLRLREVIYSTQVVDSTITRSQMMRSKDGWDKMATAFMSEPTLSYNMLQDCYYDWKLTERQSGSKEKAFKKHGKKLARVFTAYTVTNMLCAVVEAGFDFFRDTDDEEITFEDFMKQWGKNLRSDMSILAKIPYAKELVSMFEGYSASRTDTQWMQSLATFSSGIVKLFEGRGNAYKTAKDGLKAFSYATGLPFFNAWRDSTALFDAMGFEVEELEEMFNETIGDIFPSLKSK